MKPRILFFCCSILLIVTFAFAGNTGKIAGVVKDAQNGETLVGASVVIQGTTQGAATNIDGYYVILNIPPGKYTLGVSAVGYSKKTITNVSVSLDQTTTMDIVLSSTVVDVGEEVVVTATRPLVQKDLTAKTAVVGGDEIAALPVTEVGEVLSLQAGFVAGSLRGGRTGEVAYWIDGVPVTDAYNGTQVVEVNKNLVQELQLISGAFNAEYGQAMSGIVNIATKEGGSQFKGTIGVYGGQYLPDNSTKTKEIFPGLDSFRPTSIRNVEGSLSGPILGDDLTFFANGRYIYFDGWLMGYRRFTPENIAYTDSANVFHLFRDAQGRGDSAQVSLNSSERVYGQGKLTWRISPVVKLTGNYIYDHTKDRPYGQFNTGYRNYFYNPDGFGNEYNISNTLIFQLSHTLSSRTFYTIGASVFQKAYKYYLYQDVHDPRYVHPKILNTPLDTYSFNYGGTDLNRTQRSTTTWLGKIDLSSQVNESNLLKGGVEFRKHKAFYEHILLQPVLSQSDINLATASPYIQTRIPDLSSIDHDMYNHNPMEFSGYIQDKIEFKDLIVNIGVRYDYFQPDGYVLNDDQNTYGGSYAPYYTVDDPNIYSPIKPWNISKTLDERRAYWYKKASAKSKISPRLGFSFPITARGIVHFSYGHFFQIPRFERLYQNPDFKLGLGTGNVGVIGNADLEPEETINGELGVQQQLTEDIAVDVTAYLRDIRNLTGTRSDEIIVFGGSSKYSKYTNSDFGFVKGIVLTVNKRFSGGLSATADYTFQIARGSASNPDDSRNAIAGGGKPEVQLNPLGWDQRHTLNITVSYAASSWGLSSIVQYGSGTPYTPRRVTDITALLTNSQTKPEFFNIDLRGYYEFTISTIKLVAFARVFNVLDTRNEQDVYDDTGRAGITIDEARALGTNPNQYVNSIDQWFHPPTQYSEPRRIEVGLNLEF